MIGAWQTSAIVLSAYPTHIYRVGQNCIFAPYMTASLVIFLPKIPYIHHIYIYMVLDNPTHEFATHKGMQSSTICLNCT
jgi:hypothetical protein